MLGKRYGTHKPYGNNWKLDCWLCARLSTISSIYIGDDEFGRPKFETQRTEVGELLYKFKYQSDNSVIGDLVDALVNFIKGLDLSVSLIVPVPPTRARSRQPVIILAEEIGKRLNIPSDISAVVKIKDSPEIKDIYDYDERLRILNDAYHVDRHVVTGQRVLLFDDLFRSGATMNTIAENLFRVGQADIVYALAITRTRSR